MARSRPLSVRQRRFIEEYLLTGKAVHSYRHAYPGSTYRTAATNSSELLKNTEIQEELKAARRDMRRRTGVSADKIIRKRGQLAFSDIGDVLDLSDPDRPRLKAYKDI